MGKRVKGGREEKKREDIQTEGNKTWGREGRREKRRT